MVVNTYFTTWDSWNLQARNLKFRDAEAQTTMVIANSISSFVNPFN
jgi:pectate lyase